MSVSVATKREESGRFRGAHGLVVVVVVVVCSGQLPQLFGCWVYSRIGVERGISQKTLPARAPCPLKLIYKLRFHAEERKVGGGEKKRRKITTPYKRSSVEHGRFLIPLPPFREKRKCKVGEGNFLREGKNFQIFSSNFVPPSSFLPLIASNAYI